ncbi:hypothetical protein D3C71_1022710 [compost metagenome]
MNPIMEALKEKKKLLEEQVRAVNKEIYEFERNCSHNEVIKGKSWEMEQRVDDDRDYQEVRERRLVCIDCGHAWNEQRYADDPWPFDRGDRD